MTSQPKQKEPWTIADLETAVIALCNALHGTYISPSGHKMPVNGDTSKLRYVPGLPPAAGQLISAIQNISRKLPGTQEARRQMRLNTHARRVFYGVPIFSLSRQTKSTTSSCYECFVVAVKIQPR